MYYSELDVENMKNKKRKIIELGAALQESRYENAQLKIRLELCHRNLAQANHVIRKLKDNKHFKGETV